MDFTNTESQIENIKQIFADAKREDNWDLDEDMLYSYYFVGKDVEKLEKLGLSLEDKGYNFPGIFELGDEETDKPTGEFLLQVDKIETHTPESLAERNKEFANLVGEYGLDSYDGWEFGEVGDFEDSDDFDDDLDDDIIE